MADENALDLITEIPISDLEKANKINPADLFVLEQDGVAKSLSGDLLISYVMSLMGGHGSITRIAKVKTEGLVDTYRATMEDGNIFEFSVTNGIRGLSFYRVKADFTSATATYPFSDFDTPPGFAPMVKDIVMYSSGELGIVASVDTTAQTAQVFYISISLKGKEGDKGANANVWIKYASQEPTEASHSFGDIPDAWMGIATGHSDTAPTDWKEYKWNKVLGHEGPQGKPPQHYWTGTVLTIVSASGTSSADLRGDRGIPGKIQSINGYEPDPLTGDMTLGAGHKIETAYQKLMDAPVTFVTSLAIINGLGTAQIVAGRLYHITWDSALYECRAQMYGGSVCLGNLGYFGGADTGEPFVFEVTSDTYCSVTKSNSNRQTINIKIELPASVEVVPIPKEYMPTDLYARIAALEAKVGIG